MKYPKMEWGTMEAIINKLGGEKGVQKFLSNQTSIQVVEPNLEIWRTITLGDGPATTEEFVESLNKIGVWEARNVETPKFRITECKTEVDLVKISGADLGFSFGGATHDIFVRAQKLGLMLCPSDVAPQILLQMSEDELKQEGGAVVAMDSIGYWRDSYGNSYNWGLSFNTGNSYEDRSLRYHKMSPSTQQNGGFEWVFIKPRK